MTTSGGVLIYLGLTGAVVGFVSILKPLRFLRIFTRKFGVLIMGLGFLAVVGGVYLPVGETRVGTSQSHLDEFAPRFQFNEFHSIPINASRTRVYSALWKVTPAEIQFYQTLTWIRRFGRSSQGGVLNPPAHRPILETFTEGGFQMLADEPDREIVFGRVGDGLVAANVTADEFKVFDLAPLVKIVMNFRIQDADATHCLLTTETRVYAAGPQVLRGFAAYWRMIYPGSALIRRMWLRAIKVRAEGVADDGQAADVVRPIL